MGQTETIIKLLEKQKEKGITQASAKQALRKAGEDTYAFKLSTTIGSVRQKLGGYETVIRFSFPGITTDRWGLRKYVEGEIPQNWWKHPVNVGRPRKRRPPPPPPEPDVEVWIEARKTMKLTARACKAIEPMMLWPQAMEHERASILDLMDELITWSVAVLDEGEQRVEEDYLREKIDNLRKKAEAGRGNSDNEMNVATAKIAIYEQRLLAVQAGRNGNG